VVYLGAAQGGVWKTTDGGLTWTPLTDSQQTLAIGSLALDQSNPDIVYAGTGEENFSGDSYYGAGVLKSSDGGATGQLLGTTVFGGPFSSGLGGMRIGALAVHPTNGQVILAAAVKVFNLDSGIYRSADGGATWTLVLNGPAGTGVVFDPGNGNTAYAALGNTGGSPANGNSNGVYKSTDAGLTWSKLDANGTVLPNCTTLATCNAGRIVIAIAPSSPQTLFASIQQTPFSTGTLQGLYKTTDGGSTWAKLAVVDYCSPQCWYDNVIAVHPTNPQMVFVGGSGFPNTNGTVLRSLDGGATWARMDSGLHADHHAMAFSKDGGTFYVGNDGGVWSTTDPGNATAVPWTELNATLGITQFYPNMSLDATSPNLTFAGTQDNGTQRYSGALEWDWVTCGDGASAAIDFSNPANVYANCQKISIRKSTQSGAPGTFAPAGVGIPTNENAQFIPPLVMDANNSQRLWFGTYRLWRSDDGATTWTAASTDLGAGAGTIKAIAVAPGNSNVVYAGLSNGLVQMTTGATGAAPVAFTNVTGTLPNRAVTAIVVHLTASSTAYVTFSGFNLGSAVPGHVFRTTDSGTTWIDVSGNLPDTPVNDVVIDPDLANTLYVATDVGVFRSSDGGVTWSTLVSGLPRVAVLALRLHRPSRILRAATHGRGVWDLFVPVATFAFAPASLTFPNTIVSRRSPAAPVAVSNASTSAVGNISLATTGDFTQTNNCGTSLAAQASCTAQVSFAPSAAGARSGTLSITSSAPGGPQSMNLSGGGVDFTITLNRPTRPARTSSANVIRAGQSATFQLTVTASPGLAGTVGLACSGAPRKAVCRVQPDHVAFPDGPRTVLVTFTAGAGEFGRRPRRPAPASSRAPGPRRGTYHLTVTATLAAMQRAQPLEVTVR